MNSGAAVTTSPFFSMGRIRRSSARGMDDHRGIFPGFHNFIQITESARFDGPGQRPVRPDRLVSANEIPAHQVSTGQVVMAGHREKGPFEAPCHVLHESGFTASRRPFQQNRQMVPVGLCKNVHLVM